MTLKLKSSHTSHGFCESIFHIGIWISCVIKILHSLYIASKDLDGKIAINCVQDGWSIFSRKQDKSDSEWLHWKKMVFEILWLWFALHIFIVQVLRQLHAYQIRKYIFIIFTLIFFITTLGLTLTLFYLLQITFIVLVAYLTKSSLATWITSLSFLVFLVVPGIRCVLNDFGLIYAFGDVRFYFQEYLLTMGFLRYTGSALFIASGKDTDLFLSHCVDQPKHLRGIDPNIVRTERNLFTWQWLDIYCYNLYFPLSIFGPFLPFEDFFVQINQAQKPYSKYTLQKIGKAVIKSFCWFLVVEICNHFMYYSALMNNPHMLSSISLWSLAGVGYMAGQMFMVKYFILWTCVSAVASLDHITTPNVPSCIARVYLYSEMWKMFDRGLYNFLKRYIYIPMGGNRRGKIRHRLASLMSFAFVLLWHGITNSIMVWIVVNLVALFFEEILLMNDLILKKLELSPSWSRRIHSIISIPILGLSTYGIFVFLGNFESASIICYRILVEGLPMSIILLGIVGYSMIQTAKDCENYMHAKDTKFKED